MKFSLLNVSSKNEDGTINGVWLQDHTGTLETALETAKRTEKANSNKIEVAVCEETSGHITNGWYYQSVPLAAGLREIIS